MATGIYGNRVGDEGFAGTANERAAHVANIALALERVDVASEARKPGNPQLLHYFVSSVGISGTNGAPTINVHYKNEREQPGVPVQLDSWVESSLKDLIPTATIRHEGVVRSHGIDLTALASLMGW